MKRFRRLLVAGLACALLLSTKRLWASEAAQQKPCELNRTIQVAMKYLLYLPKDYGQKPRWPLVLFLHGAGERGDNLESVKKHGLPKLIAQGQTFPFIVVSPQCARDQWWETFGLTALLDEISEKYKVDSDRIYVTGLSMGGYGTWALAARTPNRFAAILPICGGGNPGRTKQIAHLPVWVFHGAKDKVVPLEKSQEMVDALKRHGGKVKFTIYPEADHDSWTLTYANPAIYEWLLQQQRMPQKQQGN